ncbi:SGNH/GDSL hydrolase family protein [Coraliomargarita parva]|uniref:SGNH/GDSL hydrolase family protein n=1 Tax=Coraliomargarita parva TaxID=3014050 RepID=UPI0022B4153B|nr:SGNH/GDSL hydrolase family protein [Coraliomargarita parva]
MCRAVLILWFCLIAGRMHSANMVVFGDSLSDGGFYSFRFTDPGGDLWHEYLADRLGYARATTSF